ncbi:SRPBCC domain-containing protein [Metabacillus sp. GX 13764]|uniref:SRPBCC domain-containing protein n=1 Tax=Metabacillus kandeliae TaxID=2900151 RepID=UPI001E419D66|nr:SRPBCC domain-containing protein [Metabacillus kandeliae]MCD7035684.1 SRPBCC domain-containing protein [Metabacillus kandeliae]
MDTQNITGKTKTAGFQIGVRRTFPISQQEAWGLVTSKECLSLWLGNHEELRLQQGEGYSAETGSGEIRVVKMQEQLRLTWKKDGWEKASTVQFRILPKENGKTVISFHQENLADERAREEMKELWESVAEWIGSQG